MTDISFAITGDNTGWLKAIAESKAAAVDAKEQIQENFEEVNSVFETITRSVGIFTAALAGGAAFREVIEATVELTTESINLGRQLGISASEASVLRGALTSVFASQEQITAASSAVTRTLREHEDAFKSLGVATREQNGDYRNSLEIILDVNEKLAQLKEGTDRNVEAQRIYGRSWAEIEPAINLTRESMEEARVRAEELGLEIGTADVEATQRYRRAMADAKDITEGAAKAIGDELVPELTALEEEMAGIGSGIVTVFRYIGAVVVTIIEVFRDALFVVGDFIQSILRQSWALFSGFSNAVARALVFDFSGAKAAWQAGWDDFKRIGNKTLEEISDSGDKFVDRVSRAFAHAIDPQSGNPPVPKPAGGNAGATDPKKSRFSDWETVLDEQKVAFQEQERAQGEFHEFSKAKELAYWQDILATNRLSQAENLQVRKQIATLSLAIDKDKFDAEIGALKAQEAEYSHNSDAKLAIAQIEAEKMKAAYGEESKQYQEAARHIVEIERQKQEQLRQIKMQSLEVDQARALGEVDVAENEAKLEQEIGLTSKAQLLQQERNFEDQRYELRRRGLEEQLVIAQGDPDRDPVAVEKLHAALEQLEIVHQGKMGQIRGAQIKEQMKDWTSLFSTLQSGFASVIQNFLNGTQSLGGTIRGLWSSIAQSVTQTLAQILARVIANAIQTRIIAAVTGKSIIAGHAAEAAAAAWKSAAAIPYVGWILGPIEAAAAYAGVLAFGDRMSSAEGGYDIPAGVNPVVQTHAQEMILPQQYADVIRGLAGGGSGGGGRKVEFIPVGADHGLLRVKDLAAAINDLQWRSAL